MTRPMRPWSQVEIALIMLDGLLRPFEPLIAAGFALAGVVLAGYALRECWLWGRDLIEGALYLAGL